MFYTTKVWMVGPLLCRFFFPINVLENFSGGLKQHERTCMWTAGRNIFEN